MTARTTLLSLTAAAQLLLLTSGCHSLPHCTTPFEQKQSSDAVKALEPQHVIEVNANGLLYDLRKGKGHRLITDANEVTNYLQQTILSSFKQSGRTNLLIFIHGGLNDRDQGLKHYLDNYQEILRRNYYPVYIVWPSGWRDTYLEHLLWVRQGIKMETVGERIFSFGTSPLMLFADLGRALTRLPMVVANNSRSDRETLIPARKLDGGSAVHDYQALSRDDYKVRIGDDYSRASDRLIRDLSYVVTLPVKYLNASLIDGLGQGAWDNMMRRTQTVYPARMNGETRSRLQQAISNETTMAVAPATSRSRTRKAKRERRYSAAGLPGFFELLEQSQKEGPALAAVTLVGHSMGTIILNRVIRDTKVDIANLVFLGAACSVEDFSTSIVPYMREHTNTQFYGLSLHPVAEAGEWYLIAGDLVPRGSLLVWIDNFLANPVSEEERTLGRWQNLFRSSTSGEPVLRRFYDNDTSGTLKERLHFRAFSVGFGGKDGLRPADYQWSIRAKAEPVESRCDNPLSHGEFTEMPYWLPEFWWK
jgi:pimeloyl-ACP methyl ester carboxylesterase